MEYVEFLSFLAPCNFGDSGNGSKDEEGDYRGPDYIHRGLEYYKRTGKARKHGYLLYGPPGTRKSTLIAATANFLNYDIYDIELTSVKDNIEL